MSTIARAGSTPEPSSEPERTWPGGLAAGLAGEVRVALLDRVAQVEERDLGRVDRALGDATGLPPTPRTWLPSWSTSLPCASARKEPLRV